MRDENYTAAAPLQAAMRLRPAMCPMVAMAYLRLMRPANLVTAAADILAASVICAAPARVFGWLVAASVCLYAGGVVLNDVFDRDLDSIERPERPIPAGTVPLLGAVCLGAGFLLAGILLAHTNGRGSTAFAAALALAVLAYDRWAKRQAVGPLVMGLCRGLNLVLGLSADTNVLAHWWPLSLLPFFYIVAITTLSRGEVHGGSRATSGLTLALVLTVLLCLFTLSVASSLPHKAAFWPFAALFVWKVGPPFWRAWREPLAVRIRTAVHAGVISLVILDACLAALFGGVVEGAALLSLSVLSAELARFFAVT